MIEPVVRETYPRTKRVPSPDLVASRIFSLAGEALPDLYVHQSRLAELQRSTGSFAIEVIGALAGLDPRSEHPPERQARLTQFYSHVLGLAPTNRNIEDRGAF
jgi:hypothetical protein